MKTGIIYLFILTSFVMFGCSGVKEVSGNPSLYNTVWKLTVLNGKTVVPPAPDRDVTLIFSSVDNSVGGSASCNRFFGEVKIEGNSMQFGNLGMTKMNCDKMELEYQFIQAIHDIDTFSVDDQGLALYTAGKKVMEFVREEKN
ncbi:MAG: hypothetical protein B6D45_05670 [Ignavibacteriales bacterium UTCHB3]|nr:MAG: hypothetical protein B6D45_05670 [Ignavibacteriales bacterium UTCHB3]